MPTEILPDYAPVYWRTLEEGLFFEAPLPHILEFSNIQEANSWMKDNLSFVKNGRMGFFRQPFRINYDLVPHGVDMFAVAVPSFDNNDVVRYHFKYMTEKTNSQEILNKKLKSSEVFKDFLIIVPNDGVEEVHKAFHGGGLEIDMVESKRQGLIHELCEHAIFSAFPSYQVAFEAQFGRAFLNKNPEDSISSSVTDSYRHSLVNMTNAWVLEIHGEEGKNIVEARKKGVVRMLANKMSKYRSMEDIQKNYSEYVPGMLSLVCSAYELERLDGLLSGPVYSDGLKPAILSELQKTPWKTTYTEFRKIQGKTLGYLSSIGINMKILTLKP